MQSPVIASSSNVLNTIYMVTKIVIDSSILIQIVVVLLVDDILEFIVYTMDNFLCINIIKLMESPTLEFSISKFTFPVCCTVIYFNQILYIKQACRTVTSIIYSW